MPHFSITIPAVYRKRDRKGPSKKETEEFQELKKKLEEGEGKMNSRTKGRKRRTNEKRRRKRRVRRKQRKRKKEKKSRTSERRRTKRTKR